MMVVIISSAIVLAFVLGFAISSLKILLVTQFDLVFLQDPNILGGKVFAVALTVATIPNIIIGFYLYLNGINANQAVKLATGNSGANHLDYIFVYMTFWAILCVLMLLIAVFYIPHHIRNIQENNAAILAGEAYSEKKNPNLKKLLQVFLIILSIIFVLWIDNITHDAESRTIVPAHIFCLVPTAMLLFFTLDTNVGTFVMKHTSTKILEFQFCRGCIARIAPLPQQQECLALSIICSRD